jgi:RNA polymerase sigma factor (sigma-70 family)
MQLKLESLFADTTDKGFVVREDHASLATSETPYSEAARREAMGALHAALAKLPRREKNILVRHYGFQGKRESLSQIGRRYRVSKQRVGQWENLAMRQLRKSVSGCLGKDTNEA